MTKQDEALVALKAIFRDELSGPIGLALPRFENDPALLSNLASQAKALEQKFSTDGLAKLASIVEHVVLGTYPAGDVARFSGVYTLAESQGRFSRFDHLLKHAVTLECIGLGVALDYGIGRQKETDGSGRETGKEIQVYADGSHMAFLKATIGNDLFAGMPEFKVGIDLVDVHLKYMNTDTKIPSETLQDMMCRGGYSGVMHEAALYSNVQKQPFPVILDRVGRIVQVMFDRTILVESPATLSRVRAFVKEGKLDQLDTLVRTANITAIVRYGNLPIKDR